MDRVIKHVSFNPKNPTEFEMLEYIKDINFSGIVKTLLYNYINRGDSSKQIVIPDKASDIDSIGLPFSDM